MCVFWWRKLIFSLSSVPIRHLSRNISCCLNSICKFNYISKRRSPPKLIYLMFQFSMLISVICKTKLTSLTRHNLPLLNHFWLKIVILTPKMVKHIFEIIFILTAAKNYTSNFSMTNKSLSDQYYNYHLELNTL